MGVEISSAMLSKICLQNLGLHFCQYTRLEAKRHACQNINWKSEVTITNTVIPAL
jgi:hypothetical protein